MDFKVSVIIPLYNKENLIQDAVASCQNLPQVGEIIIVDDGSTDNSLKIAKELESKNLKIKVLQHADKKNHGRSASRNLGIKNALYNFISFLDADDTYCSNRFNNEEKIFEDKNIDGVYGIVVAKFDSEEYENEFNKNGYRIITKVDDDVKSNDVFKTLLHLDKGLFQTNAITLRRNVFDRVAYFDTNFPISQDLHLWCKIASVCKLVSNNDKKPVAVWHIHGTNSVLKENDKREKIKEKLYIDLLKWSIKRKDLSFNTQNEFFYSAEPFLKGKSEIAHLLYFIIKSPFLIIHSFFWIKIIQIIKNGRF